MPVTQRIKTHTNRNKYILSKSGIWVRDFTNEAPPAVDINGLMDDHEYSLLVNNEIENTSQPIQNINDEKINIANWVIVSDGLDFDKKQELLKNFSKENVAIIAINGALKGWDLKNKRMINYYVINNPFKEAMQYLPTKSKYFPKCIASTRTFPKFLQKYNGQRYLYTPSPTNTYHGPSDNAGYMIDDYRNPICAALGLLYRFNAQKVLLLCCDDSFIGERPGSTHIKNDIYTYPQHLISHSIIDTTLGILKSQEFQEMKIADHSWSMEYENADYIHEEEIANFFED